MMVSCSILWFILLGATIGYGLPTVKDLTSQLHASNNQQSVRFNKARQCAECCKTTAVNTTTRLAALRCAMRKANIHAYIIPSNDEHQSEYVADHDKRLAYISGFTGSNGEAVVTLNKAALWTDSRYHLQADAQLDCNWMLMKYGCEDVPSIQEWIIQEVKPAEAVSSDPKLLSYSQWLFYESAFKLCGIKMIFLTKNLIDMIWKEEGGHRPYPTYHLHIHDVKYTGKIWKEKLREVRKIYDQATDRKDYIAVVSELDEIAWLLNLRGGDIAYTPVFRSYLLIGSEKAVLYLPEEKITECIIKHLNSKDKCDKNDEASSVLIQQYEDFWDDYELSVANQCVKKVILNSPYSYQRGSSYLLYYLAPKDKLLLQPSVIMNMKSKKNYVEEQGMKNAHIKDAVAFIQFMRLLEREIPMGKLWNEMSAAQALDGFRRKQELNCGISFQTISAYGNNSALPHYIPTALTSRTISCDDIYLVDSGGQYLDGTTDITRTLHFGNPTEEMKEIYTQILMGCIDLASTIFPRGETVQTLEIIIRRPLLRSERNYGHGSTHGIGSYLFVHESFNLTYQEGFFGSQEPGFYKECEYGIRLENIVTVVKVNECCQASIVPGSEYLTFETVSLVPYERKLINPHMMDWRQIEWLNKYHCTVLDIIGKELKRQGLKDAYNWLRMKTLPIEPKPCDRISHKHKS